MILLPINGLFLIWFSIIKEAQHGLVNLLWLGSIKKSQFCLKKAFLEELALFPAQISYTLNNLLAFPLRVFKLYIVNHKNGQFILLAFWKLLQIQFIFFLIWKLVHFLYFGIKSIFFCSLLTLPKITPFGQKWEKQKK